MTVEATDPGQIASTSSVIISGNVNLAVDETLTVNDLTTPSGNSFTLNSDATSTASLIINGSVSGAITVERYLANEQHWNFIASPVDLSGNTFSGIFSTNVPTELFRWAEAYEENGSTGYWLDMRNNYWSDSTFLPGFGYTLSYYPTKSNTYALTGEPNNSSTTVLLTRTAGSSGEGWNLVGNPFPCTLAANTNADGTNNFLNQNAAAIDDSFEALYFWDETIGTSGDYVAVNNTSDASYINNGRAFMVKAASSGNSTLNFNTSIRKHADATVFKAGRQIPRISLEVSNSTGLRNTVRFAFMEGMSPGVDPSYDAGKYQGNPDIALYSFLPEPDGNQYEILALPPLDEASTVQLGLRTTQAGSFTFSVTKFENFETGTPVTLEDRLTGDQVDLSVNPQYNFTVDQPGEYNQRFTLHFKSGVGIGENVPDNQPQINSVTGYLTIRNLSPANYNLQVIDMAGRLLINERFAADGSYQQPVGLQPGIYIVRIQSAKINFSEKLFIR